MTAADPGPADPLEFEPSLISPLPSHRCQIMQTHFRNPSIPPASADQLRSAGLDPSDLYWSGDFRCWRLSGPIAARSPYFTTGQILHELGLTPNPEA